MGSIEFNVPDDLKKYGVQRIFQTGPYVKTMYNDTPITANLDFGKLKSFGKNFREEAGKVITSNGMNASELIEKLVMHIVAEATSHYEKGEFTQAVGSIKGGHGSSSSDNEEQRQVSVMKCTAKRLLQDGQLELAQLWETVKVGGRYYLVSYDPLQNKLEHTHEISDGGSRALAPYSEEGIEPYSFQSFEELGNYIALAKTETASSLFLKVRVWAKKFYDTDVEEYTNLIAADIIFTYFQDKLGKTHYIFVWGDPDQGKGAILEIFNQLGYRGAQISDATAASIYRMLGSVEKGQIILIIDEANKLEDNTFLLNVLKVGYKGNTKIPRVMDAQSSENSKVEYFYAYCFKIIAAERLPDLWKTGGFLSRCFKIKTAPGDPKIDIGDVIDNAGDSKNSVIMTQLDELRKTLFAYRLLHYHEPIPDVKLKGISGRDRELTKPLIRLFKTHSGDDSAAVFETIKDTMHYFIKERNSDKANSLNAAVLELVNNQILLDPNSKGELTYKDIFEDVKAQFNGKSIDEKPGTLETDLYGEISAKRLAGVLRSIGGKKDKDSSGNKRVWKFEAKTLDRFSRVYRRVPDSIELEEQAATTTTLDEGDEEAEEEKENE